MTDLLGGLLAPYSDSSAPASGPSPLLMLALQAVMGQNQQQMPGPGPSGGRSGPGPAPSGGPANTGGTAEQLAARAAQAAGVPVAWAHDPKFWYQTEHESGLFPTSDWAQIVKSAHADNPTSTAYGIPQFLEATRQTYNLPLHAGPLNQLEAMFKYIRDRYGNPEGAYQHRMQTGWY